MNKEDMSNVQKLTLSAMVIALYVTVLACSPELFFSEHIRFGLQHPSMLFLICFRSWFSRLVLQIS